MMRSKDILKITITTVAVLSSLIVLTGMAYKPNDEVIKLTDEDYKNRPLMIEVNTPEVIKPDPVEELKPVELTPTLLTAYESLGEFKLTAYCSCSVCCGEYANNRPNGVVYGATGEELKAGYSIAVDPSVIPYNTIVMINGEEYKAVDCGGAIKGNRIDVYFNDHAEALKFGVQYAEIYKVIFFN